MKFETPTALDERLLKIAIDLAQRASAWNEVPVGCVIHHAPSNRIIGQGFNRRIVDHDATGHAEIVAIREAGRRLKDWRLEDCTLAVTLEPCCMCAGAIVNSRIARLVYGASDPKGGGVESLFQLCSDSRLNHRTQIVGGLFKDECGKMLTEFFKAQRALGKK
jgi:tRNA(adenine34) deaminase